MPKDNQKPGPSDSNAKSDGRPDAARSKKEQAPARHHRQDGWRETVESIVIAFILAFLFRTFEAEAFVIPTGSMAPTLFGRHKDIECTQCGYKYQVGASFEVNDNEYLKGRMEAAVCPNCRYQMSESAIKDLPVFKGDRILVNKFPYEFGDPERWDVVVFKYPEHPETNYIKRLVGLPGETIEIRHGDVYRLKDNEWAILRKDDPNKQRQLQILVYDNEHPETALHKAGWPKRWAGVKHDDAEKSIAGWSEDASGWQAITGTNGFQLPAESTQNGEFRWLRYRHFVPQSNDWQDALKGITPQQPRAELIGDFCGYNAATGIGANSSIDEGWFWNGDLTINAQVEVDSLAADGPKELMLELIEGGRKYRCRFDLETGKATLFLIETRDDHTEEQPLQPGQEPPSAQTTLKGKGKHTVTFANVDDRLCLWVDDDLVKFSGSTEYTPDSLPLPQQQDLVPVGIAARGAAVTVSQLTLQRDIYYRGDYLKPESEFNIDPYQDSTESEFQDPSATLYPKRFDPKKWADAYLDKQEAWQRNHSDVSRFELDADEFLMFGDNSPSSLDSRLWRNLRNAKHRYAVPRSALVGKAFFIYWPHGVPFLNNGQGYNVDIPILNKYTFHQDNPGHIADARYPSFKVPFYPQFERMRRIR